nr:MAG TPA: hypothetical protein [Caudoviricetes sp.]
MILLRFFDLFTLSTFLLWITLELRLNFAELHF